jgi:hypothetical protein
MKCHDPSWAGRRKKPVVWKNMNQDFKGFQEESSPDLTPFEQMTIEGFKTSLFEREDRGYA